MAMTLRRRATVTMPAFAGSIGDNIVQSFATYEEYLDSQITATDLFYLEDIDLARQLVELGYRSNAEIMTRHQFISLKEAAEQARLLALRKVPKKIFSAGKTLEDSPVLKALADREIPVRNGELSVIIFIRDYDAKGHELSGYIDYGERIRIGSIEAVFERKKRLLPTPMDLSFYNWITLNSFSNSSLNFQVIAEDEEGLKFKCKKDRKVLNVNSTTDIGDNSTRIEINTPEYKQVVIFDHTTRCKGK